jgi:hypothetical protein
MNYNHDTQHHDSHDSQKRIAGVLHMIKEREITIKPKTYFQIQLAGFIILAGFIFSLSVFLCSFIFFSVRAAGQLEMVGISDDSFGLFVRMFPWGLLALDIALIAVMSYVLRSFRFGYMSPVLYLSSAVLLVIVTSGFIVDRSTGMHDALLIHADNKRLYIFNTVYEGVRRPPPPEYGMFRGVITEFGEMYILVDLDNPWTPEGDETTTPTKVLIDDVAMVLGFEVGDRIFIAGKKVDDDIHARRIGDANDLPPPRMKKMNFEEEKN